MLMDMPPPLKPEETLQLFKKYKAGDEEAKEQIIEGNLRLVVYCARKFENTGLLLEDLTSIGLIGLMKATHSFNLDKEIKFATYAARCINNEILMFLRNNKKHRKTSLLDDVLSHDETGHELTLMDVTPDSSIKDFSEAFILEDTKQEMQEAIKELEPREQEIIFMRYIADQTQKEVSAALDISQSYISRIEKKVLKKIRKNMERKDKDMAKYTGTGNIEKAKELLRSSTLSCREIEKETGVPYSTVYYFGKTLRSKEVHKEMMKKNQKDKKGMKQEHKGDTDKAVQLLAEGKYSYGTISSMTGVPAGSLTRLRRMYQSGNYEWTTEPAKRVEIEVVKPVETPVINEEAFMGEKDLAKKKASIQPVGEPVIVELPKAPTFFNDMDYEEASESLKTGGPVYDPKKEYKMVEKTPAKTIAEVVEEFKQEIRKEVIEEMTTESNAAETSDKEVGKINRKISFKYSGDGIEIPTEDFINELNDLINNLRTSGNKAVKFYLTVEAE